MPVDADHALMPSLLTLSDVMATGHYTALSAKVGPGKTAAVVGDGAVGLFGMIAARRLGAEQVILLGRHPDRTALGRSSARPTSSRNEGDEAVERVRELTDGLGVHSVLECVGVDESTRTALRIARGVVRSGGSVFLRTRPSQKLCRPSSTTSRSPAGLPRARAYIEELLPDVLEGRIEPGRIFDRIVGTTRACGRLEDCPERFYSSFLRVDASSGDVTADELARSADRILQGTSVRHGLIVINNEGMGAVLRPAFGALGYAVSRNVIMPHRRPPDRDGEIQVDEVRFAEARALVRQMYLEDPDVPDDLADAFTDHQGKKERTIGARFFVGWVDGRPVGSCELYVNGLDAQVENVATLGEYRGRGVARLVVLRAVADARRSGAGHVSIVADEDDWPRHLYERLGFDLVGRTTEFLRAPAG